jgi:hypothetical protein
MPGHGEKKSRRQLLAIEALVAEATITAAARRAKISERTLRRWMKDPDFRAAYDEALLEIVRGAIALAQKGSVGVMGELLRVAVAGGREVDRVRAGLGVLDRIFRGVELLDLESRLASLEGTRPGADDKVTG